MPKRPPRSVALVITERARLGIAVIVAEQYRLLQAALLAIQAGFWAYPDGDESQMTQDPWGRGAVH